MRVLFLLTFLSFVTTSFAQFNKWFEDKTLRVDYYHTGDASEDVYSFDELLEEPYWGGSKTNLIDTFEYGNYYFKVFDSATNQLLFSKGYSTLFYEWQTTEEAEHIKRSFPESIIFPYPKNKVIVKIYKRNRKGKWKEMYVLNVDPDNYFIKRDRRLKYPAFDVLNSGDPAKKVDIVILPEGYSKEEMGKFVEDCNKFKKEFFSYSPYKENKEKFNIHAILAPSPDSGTDIPAKHVWKSTILNTGYYTLNSERYLMTYDYKSVRDLAANAPYDQIYILVNSKKYGGGAIYNFYNVGVNSNKQAGKILVHEFGHGFAGLGDEYYYDDTYGEMYNTKVEPWEPNLTTLKHFDKKWLHLVPDTVPIPTPDIEKYYNTVGVFEGGGYMPKKVYRPMHDCLMKTFDGDKFCPVCTEAIQKMIDFYSK